MIDRWSSQPLDRTGVVALVGERVAAGVPQHGGRLDLKAGASRDPFDHAGDTGRGESRAALADEDDAAQTSDASWSGKQRGNGWHSD
jgi:hypothetical protein